MCWDIMQPLKITFMKVYNSTDKFYNDLKKKPYF